MKMVQDFKKFALRGNMIDLAIGFTVGAAFTTVVKSAVNDILMPPIGLVTGGADFADHFIVLKAPESADVPEGGFATLKAAEEAGAVTLNYGAFLNNCIALLIVAFAMFLIIRVINRIDEELNEVLDQDPADDQEPTEKKCEYCRTTIAYRATRCPNCTSELKLPEPAVTQAEA